MSKRIVIFILVVAGALLLVGCLGDDSAGSSETQCYNCLGKKTIGWDKICCSTCRGVGSTWAWIDRLHEEKEWVECPSCGGDGGWAYQPIECPVCEGKGTLHKK